MYKVQGFIILFFIGLYSSIVLADLLPDTTVQHKTIASFAAESRLLLEAQLNDMKGIAEARCYFKTGSDNNYLYVSMNHLSGDTYQCSLPAFKKGSETLEYFFLLVNGSRQVIRTDRYVTEEAGNNFEPLEKTTASLSTVLYVYSELGDIIKADTSIIDDHIDLAATQHLDQLYGLRAGVYEPDVIPASLNIMPGYFGGFILDRINNTILPIKGFAPNLKLPLSKSNSPTDVYQNSTDSQTGSSVQFGASAQLEPSVQSESSVLSGVSAQLEASPEIVTDGPPDIGGDNWSGYFYRTDIDDREYITASVVVAGYQVTITTSLTGLGHQLSGTINANGDMLIYDSFDGEDWTTHNGPATIKRINIFDYIWPPVAGEPVPPLNAMLLCRPPWPPLDVQASDGLFYDEITVSWNPSDGATYYIVYACGPSSTDSCTSLSEVSATQYVDTRTVAGRFYFRVKACNEYDCSPFSEADMGYNQLTSIAPILNLLL